VVGTKVVVENGMVVVVVVAGPLMLSTGVTSFTTMSAMWGRTLTTASLTFLTKGWRVVVVVVGLGVVVEVVMLRSRSRKLTAPAARSSSPHSTKGVGGISFNVTTGAKIMSQQH
jgi:hypothetical protein